MRATSSRASPRIRIRSPSPVTCVRELLRYPGIATRFDQGAAIVGASGGPLMKFPSGITLYSISRSIVGEGRFIPLGIDATASSR
ncbi:MAG: hypothetical protein IPF47_13590 [Gemmatimonadetes bacterium]|nr:hypothetical protein [Gemmatimonadota bacterium]